MATGEFDIIYANALPAATNVTDNDMILIIQAGRPKRALPSTMKGRPGDPGLSVYLGVDATSILWKQGPSGTWQNLISLEKIRGPKGEKPLFRKVEGTLQLKYENEPDSAYKSIFDREELKMKFSDLTAEERDLLRLHYSDLTGVEKAELQKPATDAAKIITDKMAQIEQTADRKIADLITFEGTAKEQEADRVDAEKKRKAEEGIRKTDEAARVSAEELREQGESNRIAEEGKRVSAEEIRDNAEQARIREEGTRNTQEQAREDAEDARVLAEKNRVTEEGKRDAAEALRNQSEQTRVTEEGKRDIAEQNRVASEVDRGDAEKLRISAETGRDEAEKLRVSSEADRKTEEGKRDAAERAREDAEAARVEAERLRAQESREAIDKAESSAGLADLAAAAAQEAADKQPIFDPFGYVYFWNRTLKDYVKSDINLMGKPFSIAETYPSVEAMKADADNEKIPLGSFVAVSIPIPDVPEGSDTEEPDTAKLYIKNEHDGVISFNFIVDMSGARGFTGKTPQISIGLVTKGENPCHSKYYR